MKRTLDCRDLGTASAGAIKRFSGDCQMHVPTPKGVLIPKDLSDEKAGRMMAALHQGKTLRIFAV